MSDQGLPEIVQQLIVDRDFRERFLIDPKMVLADLGVSAETYHALAAIVPVLLAGGIGIIGSAGSDPIVNSPPVGWGRG